MRLRDPLDSVFAGPSHVKVLRALDGLPEGLAVSARQLARRSGLSHPTAARVLASLTEQGLVQTRRGLAADAFMLNPHHVLVRRLRPFLAWERQVLDEVISVLTHEIKRHAAWVSAAYLFGSSTRGDMTSGSDIDLAVAIPPSRVEETEKAFEGIADTIRLQFGNRLDVTIGAAPVEELRRPGRRGSSLWGEIVRDGVTLIA